MPDLIRPEDWLLYHCDTIVAACLNTVSGVDDYLAAALSTGFCATTGSIQAADTIMSWADGDELEFIGDMAGLSSREVSLPSELHARIGSKNRKLDGFPVELLGGSNPDPEQLQLRSPD